MPVDWKRGGRPLASVNVSGRARGAPTLEWLQARQLELDRRGERKEENEPEPPLLGLATRTTPARCGCEAPRPGRLWAEEVASDASATADYSVEDNMAPKDLTALPTRLDLTRGAEKDGFVFCVQGC